jgi:Chaperone of endosialidase
LLQYLYFPVLAFCQHCERSFRRRTEATLTNTTGGTLANVQGVDLGPNVAVGLQALESNTIASANTTVGYQALHSFTTGPLGIEQVGLCTAVGFQALTNATGAGFANSGFGYKALRNNNNGFGNTGIGLQALLSNASGSGNVAIGNNALSNNSTGNNNIAIGFNAGSAVTTAENVICIGSNTVGENVDNTCYIGQVFGQTSSGGTAVFINASGRLGTMTSSRRFKEGIKPINKASEAILALQPVTFRYKKEFDPKGATQFGLIAEDVERANPDLVVRDKQGKPYSVRYDQVNAMLLNEFLKEHATVQKLKKEIAALKAGLQQMSDELKMGRHVRLAENTE